MVGHVHKSQLLDIAKQLLTASKSRPEDNIRQDISRLLYALDIENLITYRTPAGPADIYLPRRRIFIEAKAVGERGGTATLSVEEQTGVAEPILTKKKAPGEPQTAEAEMVALDSYFGDSPPRVDFVKMDIQGFEAAALRGMKRLLKANPQMEMIVELDPERLTACGEDPTRFLRELTGHGFSLFHVSHARKARERLRPVSPEEALSACADEGRHINLYCAR